MNPTRRLFCLGLASIASSASLVVHADVLKPTINMLAGDRLAIHGYDPVAYFVEGAPRLGRADLTVEHGGAVWRFSSATNQRMFAEQPGRYLPAFGGHCAYGVSRGYLVKIDPEAWSIVEGRLYLNYDLGVRATWLKDVKGYVREAERHWPRLAAKP